MKCRLRLHRVLVSLLVCFWSGAGLAQITIQGGSLEGSAPTPPDASQTQYPSKVTVEFDMTPQEAAHLLGAIDEVIAFDSKITGLPVHSRVERQITSRDELKQLANKRMHDSEVSQSVQRSSAVLKKFGFIPRNFDLQQFAVDSTVNELAGYYDPHVKTMYLLDWLPAASQLPVMAHELDHALQDQNFDLEKWLKLDDPAANAATGGDSSEQKGARRAVAEGHATAVMIEYLLSSRGKTLAQMPMFPPEMIEKLVDRFSSPQNTQSAPLMLREEMAFPYLYGLEFVHQILLKAGKEQAYSGIFKRPPESTRQIMEPATYLSHEKLAPLPMPALEDVLGKQYEKIESGSIGEFDSMTLIKQFGNLEQAKKLPTNWRGDYFYAATPTRVAADGAGKATVANNVGIRPEDIALLYVSRWATPVAARDFADFYRVAVAKRYPDAKPAETAPHASPADVGEWNTAEGKVTTRVEGNLVVVLESFDAETASRINTAVLKTDK